ncbi:MAG: barstar family protein [Bacteroidia bacterium]|nr:barstar family protein [Bacteroidia bacterium]MCO5254374.1 barstar family protein [Bacteroidota bacterium]
MATFQNNPDEWQRLDWSILQNGWTSLYWKKEILETDLIWFKSENYSIVEFDCKTWTGENEMHKRLKDKLMFPDYYGENWDALNDCLSDLEITKAGQIVVFRHLDNLDTKSVHTLLDIFARNSRLQMLFGKRLIVLAQVDNPNYQIDQVGATPVMWNGAEWLDSNRK